MIVDDYELKALTKQLAEIFIMTEGNSSHPVQYLKCRDTKHSTRLHKGNIACLYYRYINKIYCHVNDV